MIIIILTIIRKFAKITINFYNGKINNININPELIETTVYFLLSLTGILLCQLEQNKLFRKIGLFLHFDDKVLAVHTKTNSFGVCYRGVRFCRGFAAIYKAFRFSILRASAGDAMSLPSSRERRTTFSTSSPFDFANTPREI